MEVRGSKKLICEYMVEPPKLIKLCILDTTNLILCFHIILVDIMSSTLQVLESK